MYLRRNERTWRIFKKRTHFINRENEKLDIETIFIGEEFTNISQ